MAQSTLRYQVGGLSSFLFPPSALPSFVAHVPLRGITWVEPPTLIWARGPCVSCRWRRCSALASLGAGDTHPLLRDLLGYFTYDCWLGAFPSSHRYPQASSPTMTSPQYDAIGSAYLYFKSLPPVRVETGNLRIVTAPYVAGARVLDLTCGAGHYSRLLLEWGAASIVGVNISSTMIAVAERQQETLPEAPRKRLRFEVGDAARLGKVDSEQNGAGTGFDLVTGM